MDRVAPSTLTSQAREHGEDMLLYTIVGLSSIAAAAGFVVFSSILYFRFLDWNDVRRYRAQQYRLLLQDRKYRKTQASRSLHD